MLLLNSWSGHCKKDVQDAKPLGKYITLKIILNGSTERIQTLNVYGFRIWKNYIRRFSYDALFHNCDVNLHLRNNVIKLQSLIHNLLSSSKYKNMFHYAWYESDYADTKLYIYRCSWRGKALCLKHFFHDYHFSDQYAPQNVPNNTYIYKYI